MKKENFKVFFFLIIVIFFLFLNIGLVQAEENVTSTPTTTSTVEVIPYRDFSVNLNIRYQDTFIFSGAVSTTPKEILSDSAGVIHPVTSSSTVLSALIDAASFTPSFTVSQLDYYDAYKSFYLNCLTLTAVSSTPICGNWNYVVDGLYPSLGMDSYELFGGETIYLYFGNSWQITASTSTFPIGTTTTLNTWRYNFDNLEQSWLPDAGDLIDISVTNPNPLGWWDATLTTTTLISDSLGQANYVFSATGTYFAKITSADYSKWSSTITLTVLDAPVSTSTATSTLEGGISGSDDDETTGGGNGQPNVVADIPLAEIKIKTGQILNFLKSQQDEEGKIIDGGLTDWAIISFAANGEYAEDIQKGGKSLLDFARDYNFSDASDLNVCASYPRHILALLSGGVAPVDNKIQDLLIKIKSQECYQNHQFGQNGINDDVFALLSILAVNNDVTEPIITDLVGSIIKDQTLEGAFTWAGYASPDITGAAINALNYASQKGVLVNQEIFSKAKNYLKTQQLADGGWGFGSSDALTTAWAVMGLNSLREGQSDWAKADYKNPWSVLTSQLNSSGFYESVWSPGTVDWFAEKHAVPALLGKTWPIILKPRQKNAETPSGGGILTGAEVGDVYFSDATSTLIFASSTVSQIFEESSSTLSIFVSSTPILSLAELPLITLSVSDLENEMGEGIRSSQNKVENRAVILAAETQKGTVFVENQKATDLPHDPFLPWEKKVAETAVAGSAVILTSSTLLILSRLLLAII